ncbi:MAG: DUF4159 domain-containing protein [Vicinamibacterales bacterium]
MAWPSTRSLVLLVALIAGSAAVVSAQRGGLRGFGLLGAGSGTAPAALPDRHFVICRLVYPQGRQFAAGWRTDYPLGETNLSIRFGELTRTRVSTASDGSPNHYLVRLTDEQLFQCPMLVAGDIGSMRLSDEEAGLLRTYLLKGGFLWTDDQWGSTQWAVWMEELAKIFDPSEYPMVEVPLSDPLFRAQFEVEAVPQIPNIQYWRATHETSEQGADSATAHLSAVRDHDGRIMVLSSHNTDIADAFEREGEDPDYFYQFSPKGYALGVNILLHALTH